jgi:hypothetical protein
MVSAEQAYMKQQPKVDVQDIQASTVNLNAPKIAALD